MNRDRVQLGVGLLVVFLAGASFFSFLIDRLRFRRVEWVLVLGDPTFAVLLFALVFFLITMRIHSSLGRLVFSMGFFSLSAPLIFIVGPSPYFGPALIIGGTILFQRFGFFERYVIQKGLGIFVWSALWVFLGTAYTGESPVTGASTIAFLGINLVMLYFLFEEKILSLLAANKVKDAEIARLEPLSVLGERVAHVAHTFRNNLNQVSTDLSLLEQLKDHVRAAEKLREFSHTLNERIENILMVSRAGVDLEPEVFDVARVRLNIANDGGPSPALEQGMGPNGPRDERGGERSEAHELLGEEDRSSGYAENGRHPQAYFRTMRPACTLRTGVRLRRRQKDEIQASALKKH